MRDRIMGGGLLALAMVALIGCSSSTGGSTAPSSAPAASAAAPSTAASAAAPSEAAPSEAAPSQAAASEAIPSFAFPSDDKALEAVIPDKICGATVQKLSLKGKDATGENEIWPGILQALGKSISDVSAAAAFSTKPGCSVTIIKINGADEGKLRELLQAEAAKAGITYTKVSVGGKDVFTSDPAKFGYSWIKGDGAIIITADTAAHAAELVAALP
jgi:hypothetical protein